MTLHPKPSKITTHAVGPVRCVALPLHRRYIARAVSHFWIDRLDDNVRCLRNFHHTHRRRTYARTCGMGIYGIPLICTVFNVFLSSVVRCSRFIALVIERRIWWWLLLFFFSFYQFSVMFMWYFIGWTSTNRTVGKAACALYANSKSTSNTTVILFMLTLLFLFSFFSGRPSLCTPLISGGGVVAVEPPHFGWHFGSCHCRRSRYAYSLFFVFVHLSRSRHFAARIWYKMYCSCR